jgi:hypothetical protein
MWLVAGLYGLCAHMSERNQDFHNHHFLHLRENLFLRKKLAWVLDVEAEKDLMKKILQVDTRWKKIKNTHAIIFDLKKEWESTKL